jgi:hypothetical protein
VGIPVNEKTYTLLALLTTVCNIDNVILLLAIIKLGKDHSPKPFKNKFALDGYPIN